MKKLDEIIMAAHEAGIDTGWGVFYFARSHGFHTSYAAVTTSMSRLRGEGILPRKGPQKDRLEDIILECHRLGMTKLNQILAHGWEKYGRRLAARSVSTTVAYMRLQGRLPKSKTATIAAIRAAAEDLE